MRPDPDHGRRRRTRAVGAPPDVDCAAMSPLVDGRTWHAVVVSPLHPPGGETVSDSLELDAVGR